MQKNLHSIIAKINYGFYVFSPISKYVIICYRAGLN